MRGARSRGRVAHHQACPRNTRVEALYELLGKLAAIGGSVSWLNLV